METDEFVRSASIRMGVQALLIALLQSDSTRNIAFKAKEVALTLATMSDRAMQGSEYERQLSQYIYNDLEDLFLPVTAAQNDTGGEQ